MLRLFTALTCAALATLGSAAAAPLPTLSVEKAIETVACVGDRRNYRNFNHCWSVNIRRATPRAVSSYCSRICTAARK
jgi:hypothetical protein